MATKRCLTLFGMSASTSPSGPDCSPSRRRSHRRSRYQAAKTISVPCGKTVIPGGRNCDPRRKTKPVSYSCWHGATEQSPLTYGVLVDEVEAKLSGGKDGRRTRETVIPDGKTVISGGKSVIPGGRNRDPRRKIWRFAVISGGRNRDPRRKGSLLNTCKSGNSGAFVWRPLLVVSLFIVVLTNKRSLDRGKLCGYLAINVCVADGEKRG